MSTRLVHQAGAVVFRIRDGRPQILLVRARRTPGQWIFPKGYIEDGESSKAAAIRETQEEAGIDGRAVARLRPPLEFEVGQVQVRVQYYLVLATGKAESIEEREKRWVAPEAALRLLSQEGAKELLRSAVAEIQLIKRTPR